VIHDGGRAVRGPYQSLEVSSSPSEFLTSPREQVPVPIGRDPNRRVPEVVFQFLHMPAVRGEQRGARVAQAVKAQLLTEAGAGHRERKWRA
jgi:hypothetical protein